MEVNTIKFKTVQFINGVSYLPPKQVDDLKYIITHNLKIEKTQDTDIAVEEGIKIYFEMQNNLGIVNNKT